MMPSPREVASATATGGTLLPGFDEESIINMAKQDIVKLFALEVRTVHPCTSRIHMQVAP